MTTAQETINAAYREAQLTAVGNAPRTAEVTEALDRLNSFIKSLIGSEMGELTQEWQVPPRSTAPVDARYPLYPLDEKKSSGVWPYPPPNVTLSTQITSATTVYLDQNPDNGARIRLADAGSTADLTIDANGRKIEGAATLTVTPADVAPRQWIYRQDLSEWIRLATLGINDDLPFPDEYDDLFIIGLALRISPRNGKPLSGESLSYYREMRKKFKAAYRQRRRMPTDHSSNMETYQAFPRGFGNRNLLR